MRIRTALFGVFVTVAAGASAQMPPNFKMPSMRYNPALVLNPAVQKDMHVSPAVAAQVQQVVMSEGMKLLPFMMGAMSGKKQSAAEQTKSMNQMMGAYDKMQAETVKLLTPPQRTRLHEITIQSMGPQALVDPKTASEVGLTSQQTAKLATTLSSISKRDFASVGNMFGGGKKPDPSALTGYAAKAAEAQKKTRKDSEAALSAILTPAQRAKWIKIQGRHIELTGFGGMGSMFGG